MKVPFSYVARNLWVRKLTTMLTAGGMALVVFVFAAVLMLDAGLKSTLVATGSPDNVVVIRQGSQTECRAGSSATQAALIETAPEVARDADARSSRRKSSCSTRCPRSTSRPSAATSSCAACLTWAYGCGRGEHRCRDACSAGSSEIVVGGAVALRFRRCRDRTAARSFAGRQWTVVGLFDAGKTAFDSEIWGDVEQMMQAFRRTAYSSVIARLALPESFTALKARLDDDPRLKVDIKPEARFYADQSSSLSNFITLLGMALSVIFSLGAMIGAAITMYAAVATRTGEIGTLRALGFQRGAILVAFLSESLLLALVGGVVGLRRQFLTAITVSTTNSVVLGTRVLVHADAGIVAASLVFAITMGFVGGFLPAIRRPG
jgi:ABC-type lipoprotein release transport system permease subunit